MNMITEDYVSFETAKLLKDKGFDEYCYEYYYTSKYITYGDIKQRNLELFPDSYSAPTLQMAMKWLREVHHLFIELKASIDLIGNPHYAYSILGSDGKYKRENYTSFDWTYEEACDTAIKYCLEKLI